LSDIHLTDEQFFYQKRMRKTRQITAFYT